MFRSYSLLLLMMFVSLTTFAQTQRNCGAMEHLEYLQNQDPKMQDRMERIEQHTQKFMEKPAGEKIEGIISIPVVVHVIYSNSSQNISDAQILSQIQVLNDDFRRTNADASNTPSAFLGVAADTEIEFCMATVDPNGNPTTGITRKSSSTSEWGTNDAMKSSSSGGVNAWPTGQYLNMWVCNIGGGILGYAQFPGGSAATDGVVVSPTYFGTTGTAQAPFDLGRTTTHEVGHWLNLRHIWGDGGCNVDDFVADTPTSDGANYGCATTHVSCSSTDMVQNYMDYSDDACMNLYTQGQKTRMRALFDPGGFRASLVNSAACGAPAEPTCDDGVQNGTETGVDCGGSCPTACPTCFDGIQNGNETGVDCGGSCASACPCFGTQVTVSITFDNYPEETSWSLRDASGAVVAQGGTYGSQPDGSTINETICLADGCYDFVINDQYGDGICCSYGNGSYSVTAGGTELATGGTFTQSETTNFCLPVGGGSSCTDGIMNGDETGVDCGGPDCPACPSCDDNIMNGDETGVDCGGSCPTACPTCNDGVMNGEETGVDCGGSCAACPTCNDGVMNGNETGVDCGGPDCNPCNSGCSGTEVTVSITLDQYPQETTWTLTNASGATVAAGGPYNGQPSGSTVSETNCLGDGCYTFTINDQYGDGICCAYGNGSYSVTGGGAVLASGGSFASSESREFCLGNVAGPTCTDGVMNGNETGVDCGGPDCPACPTCTDGVMNGNETGIDCGGPDCAPCGGGVCSYVTINSNNFEAGWGIWNDGGSDASRSSNYAPYSSSGSYSIRLRDNTSTSVMTTDNLNLSAYEELTVDFGYYPRSMDNANEDFWLQISTNGGSSYTTVEEWNLNDEFVNDQFYTDAVVIAGPFTSNTRLRFRCDASGNTDYVYIDDVVITGCVDGGRDMIEQNASQELSATTINATARGTEVNEVSNAISEVKLYPNPATDRLNIQYLSTANEMVKVTIYDLTGKAMMTQTINAKAAMTQMNFDVSSLQRGYYLVELNNGVQSEVQKFIKM